MELMSSLLFYAFVVMLPQALGRSHKFDTKALLDTNDLAFLQKPSHFVQKKLLLNMNSISLVKKFHQKDTVFTDVQCMKCRTCMKRAIKEYIHHKKYRQLSPAPIDMQYELLLLGNNSIFPHFNRPDRDRQVEYSSNVTQSDENSDNDIEKLKSEEKLNGNLNIAYQFNEQNNTSSEEVENEISPTTPKIQQMSLNSIKGLDKLYYEGLSNIRQKREPLQNITEEKIYRKKTKYDISKVERLPNAITVTKYNLNGKTYALKVKETIHNSKSNGNKESLCNVFKVVHTYACDTKDAETLLSAAKSGTKIKKKLISKKVEEQSTSTTTQPSSTKKVSYIKRDIISQISKENYPSIEDIY